MISPTSPLLHHSIQEKQCFVMTHSETEVTTVNDGKVSKSRDFQVLNAKLLDCIEKVKWRLHGDSNPGYSRERGLSAIVISIACRLISPLLHHSKILFCFCPDCVAAVFGGTRIN